jgi:hypothetical protein
MSDPDILEDFEPLPFEDENEDDDEPEGVPV